MLSCFSHSCGYKNAFEQYADVISKKYPEIVVVGRIYPASGYNSLLAKILFLAKFFILACIICGTNLSPYIGRFASAWSWCISNKFYSCAMIFLICNMIEGQLISTGKCFCGLVSNCSMKEDDLYVHGLKIVDMVKVAMFTSHMKSVWTLKMQMITSLSLLPNQVINNAFLVLGAIELE